MLPQKVFEMVPGIREEGLIDEFFRRCRSLNVEQDGSCLRFVERNVHVTRGPFEERHTRVPGTPAGNSDPLRCRCNAASTRPDFETNEWLGSPVPGTDRTSAMSHAALGLSHQPPLRPRPRGLGGGGYEIARDRER